MNQAEKITGLYSIDALRIVTGTTLLLVATSFIEDTSLLESLLWSEPLPFLSFILCHLIIASHLAGGFMLIFGFVSRIAALIQLPMVMGAFLLFAISDSIPEQFWALNLAPLMFLALSTLAIAGPGTLSVDHLIGLEDFSSKASLGDDSDTDGLAVLQFAPKKVEEDAIEQARRLAA